MSDNKKASAAAAPVTMWRWSADQQQQIIALSPTETELFLDAIGHRGTPLGALCRAAWMDETAFQRVVQALNKEVLRSWLRTTAVLFSAETWDELKVAAWGKTKAEQLHAPERTYEELVRLRQLVVSELQLVPVPAAAPRIPIPEATRQTLLHLAKQPSIAISYLNFAAKFQGSHASGMPWQMDFASMDELCQFQAQVDQLERTHLMGLVDLAVTRYPKAAWKFFMVIARQRFGDRVDALRWWLHPNMDLEDLRTLLIMLQTPNVDKLAAPLEATPAPAPAPMAAVTKEELTEMRDAGVVVPEKPAARVPLPEATRQTILRIKQELVEQQVYLELCSIYTRAFVNPLKNTYEIASDWTGVDFARKDSLERFQTHVDRAERLLLKQKILKAVEDYPTSKWCNFKESIIAHFGDRANVYQWWASDDVSLEDLRFYLVLLGHHNVDKVKLMTRQRLEATPPKDTEPKAPLPEPAPLTMAERKIRFLHQLRDKAHIWGDLASYMDQDEPNLSLSGIARKVTMTEDEARLSDWEAIVNKTTKPEHIFWKLLDRELGDADLLILSGLDDFPRDRNESRSVQQRLLYFWSTYPQPKRELICAYLDKLPKKK